MERIWPSEEFQYECFQTCQTFFTRAILPELFGKFYSRPPQQKPQIVPPQPISDLGDSGAETLQPTPAVQSDIVNYCYCKGPEHDIMVACDNQSCPHGSWFHLECLGLKAPPRSLKWYCPDCRKSVLRKKA